MDLDLKCTQAEFGALVGMTQPAVSDLLSRGVLVADQPARVWLLAYCQHMREMAAGRDLSGELSVERARLARESADKIAMANAVTRRELIPVSHLEAVLNAVARQISTRLDALVPQLRRRMPDLPPALVAQVAAEIAACRELCAAANLGDADRIARADGDDEEEGAAHV